MTHYRRAHTHTLADTHIQTHTYLRNSHTYLRDAKWCKVHTQRLRPHAARIDRKHYDSSCKRIVDDQSRIHGLPVEERENLPRQQRCLGLWEVCQGYSDALVDLSLRQRLWEDRQNDCGALDYWRVEKVERKATGDCAPRDDDRYGYRPELLCAASRYLTNRKEIGQVAKSVRHI